MDDIPDDNEVVGENNDPKISIITDYPNTNLD